METSGNITHAQQVIDIKLKSTDLHDLLTDHLKSLYWTEQFLSRNLVPIIAVVSSEELQHMLDGILKETELHIKNLEEVFAAIGEKTAVQTSHAVTGLRHEAFEMIQNTDRQSFVRDVSIVASVQKITHYKIAVYGTLRATCVVLGYLAAADLLEQALRDEKKMDEELTRVAEIFVYKCAASE
ncbi:DUF892 family protein [Solitalea sp. MAHUQ-68]|uniref:DUF892 family protein n=1 Tax=Solitalea agri TaxID=2953739 RepID=A0A9X2F5P5_9SPHI|nr:DUF892 family protein [Solitalea agri]MCO4294649.1 DUF892 family protein [Solitalea agri]